MNRNSLNVGVVGCGMISDWYFKAAKRFKQMNIVACADLKSELAEKQGAAYGIPVRPVDEIFDDPAIELVLNLTPPKAHCSIARRTLEAGKHAYSEKPIGINLDEAGMLLELAERKQLYIGCAPDTFLGGGPQTARKLLDDGWIGAPIAGTVIFLGRGPEKWAHAPAFYDLGAGPMLDIGPYFITQLVNLLGPARAVTAQVTKGAEFRTGGPDTVPPVYPVNVPTHQSGVIEFANGAQITVVGSYEVFGPCRHPSIEIYGTRGSLAMHHPNFFGGEVKVFQNGYEDWRDVPSAFIYNTDARSIGVADLIEAVLERRPARASGRLAYHVLDIIQAFETSSRLERKVVLKSDCERPAAMPAVTEDGALK